MAGDLNEILLTGNLGTSAATGFATFTASNWLTDATNQMLDPPVPVSLTLPASGTFSTSLLATDSPSPLPAGWNWTATFQLPGIAAYSTTFFLPAGPVAFTATDASPCVFTFTPTAQLTAYVNGTGVQLSGSLPTGFGAGTTYYVVNAAGDTFELAATSGGDALGSTSTGSGDVLTVSADISGLASVGTPPAGALWMPQPGGTPTAGAVPAAAGYGQASNWTVLDAADVGALPLSGGQMTGALAPAVADVSDAATVTINAAAGNDADLTLTQDTLLETPLNPVDGQKLLLRVAQGAGAPWSLSYSDAWLFTTGLPAPALSQSEGDVDLLGWRYDAGLGGWLFLGSVTGFAS